MKIYIIRHELRDLNDPTFSSELLERGHHNARTIVKDKLNTLNITHIYSSPFLRTLQTVFPYSKENNKKINVEYGIAETIDEPLFKQKPNITLSSIQEKIYNINKNYSSIWNKNTLKYKEKTHQIKYRVKMFLNMLTSKHENTHDNILIATHMSIVNILLSLISGKNIDVELHYPMGQISTVENNNIRIV
tara:strand:+ start:1097 stop:1666 length:570 start_codon:yes stop_codon:yes gene_type:complete